jgi:hypothetical protein
MDHELKRLLAAELSAIWDGYDQYLCASRLQLHQPQVSALRHGRTSGFSSDRLLRLLGRSGYNVEVVLREMPRRIPPVDPSVTVQRYDRNGRLVERPPPGPVKRVRRWSGEVEVHRIERGARRIGGASREVMGSSEQVNSRFDMDDE